MKHGRVRNRSRLARKRRRVASYSRRLTFEVLEERRVLAPLAIDVLLLFDDTGSFSGIAPTLQSQFPQLIQRLGLNLPDADLAFGVARFEDYTEFAGGSDRPFILNQPILAQTDPQFTAAINAALSRTTPGSGGDLPESAIEALFQVATGLGFDGNGNSSTTESGRAGQVNTQTSPGASGDVPAYSSFLADAGGPVVPASGTLGGVGFRPGAVKLVLLATDVGFGYEPDGRTSYVGVGGVTVPATDVQVGGRGETPDGRGATIQQAIDALLGLDGGVTVIGLGTTALVAEDPRGPLEALARLTGAINRSNNPIDSGIAGDPIGPGEPLYFFIDPRSGETVADAIATAIIVIEEERSGGGGGEEVIVVEPTLPDPFIIPDPVVVDQSDSPVEPDGPRRVPEVDRVTPVLVIEPSDPGSGGGLVYSAPEASAAPTVPVATVALQNALSQPRAAQAEEIVDAVYALAEMEPVALVGYDMGDEPVAPKKVVEVSEKKKEAPATAPVVAGEHVVEKRVVPESPGDSSWEPLLWSALAGGGTLWLGGAWWLRNHHRRQRRFSGEITG
jgi:hypothetical protein